MLAKIYASHQKKFEAMAQTWLAAGATAFGVSTYKQMLAQWPAPGVNAPEITAPIECLGLTLGELHVSGLIDNQAQERLAAEAAFLSHLIMIEGELEAMTAELIHSQDQLLALYDIARSTRNRFNIDDLAHSLIRVVGQLIHVQTTFIWLQLPERPSIIVQYPGKIRATKIEHLCQQVLKSQRHLFINEYEGNNLLPSGINSVLICPIQIQGSTVGALGLINKLDGDFTSPDHKLIEAISQQVEAQFENALLHEENIQRAKMQMEMEWARKVQLQLLPQQPPAIPGLELAGGSLPALQVGGDFYDFINKTGSPLFFTVGDVSGKGLSSALLMAMLRTVIRNAVRHGNALPQDVLDQANEDLYADLTEVSMFATVFVGRYEPGKPEMIYANAGHSPVIHCPAGEPARLLKADGTAVGVLPTNLAVNQTLPFHPGDVLVVGTDGFNDARNREGEAFGYARLMRQIEALTDRSAAEIATALYQALSIYGEDQPQDDDQTLIVIKGVPA
jgi:sigma-B regulation protein RsbU (phosphoserine phosphatase)